MHYKWLILFSIIFFSCKRELQISASSVIHSDDTKESAAPISDQKENVFAHGAALSEGAEASLILKPSIPLAQKTEVAKYNNPTVKKYNTSTLVQKNKNEIKAVKKEMDPRLSTALIMTIFGGVAVTLGLVFSKYIPAGLFVFAFGIVFVVGLITLFMYLANPKPKM